MDFIQPASRRLDKLTPLINWKALGYRVEKIVARAGGGRPPYDSLKMFKVMLLQRQYDLSNRLMEEALYDRFSFRRFCGFSLDDPLPDATTIQRFPQILADKTSAFGKGTDYRYQRD